MNHIKFTRHNDNNIFVKTSIINKKNEIIHYLYVLVKSISYTKKGKMSSQKFKTTYHDDVLALITQGKLPAPPLEVLLSSASFVQYQNPFTGNVARPDDVANMLRLVGKKPFLGYRASNVGSYPDTKDIKYGGGFIPTPELDAMKNGPITSIMIQRLLEALQNAEEYLQNNNNPITPLVRFVRAMLGFF